MAGVQVKIDSTTPLSKVLPFMAGFSPETTERLKDWGRRKGTEAGDWWQITVGAFCDLLRGDFTGIGIADPTDVMRLTALQYYTMQSFADFTKTFSETIEKLTPPMTEQERQVAKRLPQTTTEEAMLIFSRQYFGLRNFAEAEKTLLIDFLIAKKDVYCKAKFDRELQAEMRATQRARR